MSQPQGPKSVELSPGGMRHRQKNRTRKALLNAAAQLVRQGREPTVAEVAEVGEVSRATAYRYFPTQESLLAEMRMFAPEGPIEMFDRVVLETADPVERVGVLARQVSEWAFQNETALRTWLRLSLDPETGVRRPGHRMRWIAEALQPLYGKVDRATLDRLSSALTILFGIDPIVPLTDFAELPPARAIEVIEWTARTLVRSVVESVPLETEARGARARQPTLVPHATGSPNKQLASRHRQDVRQTEGA
jgi:AcrR family transcriptional regulator